jgi:hypothetical protein
LSAPGRRGALCGALVALALGVSACGGDDETTATTTDAGASGASGVTGAVVSADDIVSCLGDAGLEATVDSPVTGLEGEHEKVYVAIGDSEQGAVLAVFESEEAAEAESEAFAALGGVAAEQVSGNVAWGFDAIAGETPDDEAAIEGCLP